MKDKIKIFIMTMVAFVATTFSTSGLPESENQWVIFGVTIVGTMLTYIAKNFISPSTSVKYTLNWPADMIGGLILAVGSAVSNYVAQLTLDGEINWKSLGKLILVVIFGYLSKTLVQQPKQDETA